MGERFLNMCMRAYSHMRTSLATDLFGMLYSVIPEGKIADKEQAEDHAHLEGETSLSMYRKSAPLRWSHCSTRTESQ